ncbi:MAG: glycosyltransferase family 9 protein, partial [Bacteroidia bacterium]
VEAYKRKVTSSPTESYITLSPASVWFTKQFPPEKWIEWINACHPKSTRIFLLGGPADVGLCEGIRLACKDTEIVVLAGKLRMLESAALMSGASMNYTNDSAPLHLASAMNAPVTVLYTSTIPKFGFGPLSDKRVIVETTEKLDCRPCGIHGFRACPKKHFKCALSIRKEDIPVISKA